MKHHHKKQKNQLNASPVSKKGFALDTFAIILVSIISFAILLLIFIRMGLLDAIQGLACTMITTASMFMRGTAIKFIWIIYWVLLGVFALVVIGQGTWCRNPVGAAVCAALYAVFVGIVTYAVFSLQSSIPIVDCPNPDIKMDYGEPCLQGIGVEKFKKRVAELTVDCWSMYSKGKLDPLAGKVPPNPRTCSVVYFNLNQSVTFAEMITWMATNNYSDITGETFLDAAGGPPAIRNNGTSHYNVDQNLSKGRLYIKYGDDHTWASWYSPDCEIYKDFTPKSTSDLWLIYAASALMPPAGVILTINWMLSSKDHVYWCFDKDVTCDAACNNIADPTNADKRCN